MPSRSWELNGIAITHRLFTKMRIDVGKMLIFFFFFCKMHGTLKMVIWQTNGGVFFIPCYMKTHSHLPICFEPHIVAVVKGKKHQSVTTVPPQISSFPWKLNTACLFRIWFEIDHILDLEDVLFSLIPVLFVFLHTISFYLLINTPYTEWEKHAPIYISRVNKGSEKKPALKIASVHELKIVASIEWIPINHTLFFLFGSLPLTYRTAVIGTQICSTFFMDVQIIRAIYFV